jgi:hypothetical protein
LDRPARDALDQAHRLAMSLMNDPATALAAVAYEVLRCGLKGAETPCPEAPEIPPVQTEAGSDRERLIDLLEVPVAVGSPSDARWCRLFAVLALERLGRIAELRDERDSAVAHYKALLSIWPGLDAPIAESLRVRRRLNRLEGAPLN